MDDGIEFGEVEHAAPEGALRPDQNRHYAVAAYGSPKEGELPIFVDLDVVRDMEVHALSDTSVELGGVLLGGTHVDEEGRPFVVITDSLRAQHYESTKGSFTFTHDTWSAITREREQFPPELQMVGWYHTHPDWGVFLSGMDMFICDNFFNKSLDVAYVIDPCRGDRAMFQWTGDASQRVRRTSGFFVTASRFRAEELEYYVAELSGTMPATTTQRSASGSYGAPVVHLHQPQSAPQPPWQAAAILGGLALQFLLVALIAWKTLVPTESRTEDQEKLVTAIEDLQESMETRQAMLVAEERLKTTRETMDQVVSALSGPGDSFTELQTQVDQAARLEDDVAARDSHIRELSSTLDDVRTRLSSLEDASEAQEERLKREISDLDADKKKLAGQLAATKAKLATYQPKTKSDKPAAAPESGHWWWWIGGAVAIAIVLVGGVWWIGGRRGEDQSDGISTEDGIEAARPKSNIQSPKPETTPPDA